MVMVMRRVDDVLWVRLDGYVDDDVLELLCGELQMEITGRLDDGYDGLFGERSLRPEDEGDCSLELYRESDTEWTVELSALPPLPTPAEIAELREQIFEAARKAKMTATQIYPTDRRALGGADGA